jgi:small-conductance mechanosensitive channel
MTRILYYTSQESIIKPDQSVVEIHASINIFGAQVEVFAILVTIIILVVGLGLAKFSKVLVSKYGKSLPHETRKNVGRVTYYGIAAIAMLSAMGTSGLDLSGIFLAGGIAGIIIGFATQSLVSNLISGIFLHLDKPMKIGDPVLITGKLPEIAGVIIEVTMLSTRFRMFDGVYVRMPNTDVFLSQIRNFSGAAARRVEFTVAISLSEDASEVIRIVTRKLSGIPLVLVEPEVQVYVENIGESGTNLTVRCWVPFSQWFPMKKDLVEIVKKELDDNNIEIPFPQRALHLTADSAKELIFHTNSLQGSRFTT